MAELNMLAAINQGLAEEMRENDRILVFGEDVGKSGGVFLATKGLQEEFGERRVFDTPLAEAGILGMAVGLAINGYIPVPEIQFVDFIYPAYDMVVTEIAKFRYRSAGQYSLPMVIRTPSGGGIRGGHYHSQSPEAYFAHTPGLKVVIPSNPYDAKGLLIAAIRDPDPVMFLEPKKLYRSVKGEVPKETYTVEIGKAKLVKEGNDVTVVAYGAMLHTAVDAAGKAAQEGVSVEVIDLRTIVPYDADAILASVRKTGRLVVVVEAPSIASMASEISALVAEEAVEYLASPVLRVTGFDTPYPYALDNLYLPDSSRVFEAIKKVATF
ncbi:alpha-ketoacid dehydrogenase subunit beta [candidate division WOR-3 bacterium]|nr:alpha-ketoacid dehydrogenase subunit beta [candidate division WOR-3 bacterium]